MPPLPTPTDEDVNDVREVTGETSRTAIAALIDSLNDAEWSRALDLIGLWHGFTPGDLMDLQNGGREGVYTSDQAGLDDIRRRMRLLLGLPEFRDASITGFPTTTSVPVLVVY